jgi:hypothetical protein
VLLGLFELGCSFENYGLDYTRIELSAERADATPASRLPRPVCVTLPVLTGSVVEQRQLVEDSLGVTIRATSEAVELSFFGAARPAAERVFDIEELDGGFQSEIELESRGGTRVRITLSSPCSADSDRSP